MRLAWLESGDRYAQREGHLEDERHLPGTQLGVQTFAQTYAGEAVGRGKTGEPRTCGTVKSKKDALEEKRAERHALGLLKERIRRVV